MKCDKFPFARGDALQLTRWRCPARERRDGRSAKVIRWAPEPASSQCNVRPCETRYSTTDPRIGECGQILETLKGQPPSDCKLQIYDLVEARRRLADGHGVTETAFAIGYTSASQFSREYKRAFRRAPVRDLFIPNR
ncbi:hypothetical protein BRX36_11185 [Sphingomonas sp. S-NIH.Pt1_0416]|nr:hypothetical protein BRX36_11185 [Sphingomonas sp. S-NIH.Pt1_0416]